jgi:hypothetical protein
MENQEKSIESTLKIKKSIDNYIATSERRMMIQEAMIETLEQMLALEKKESKTWRSLSFIGLGFLIICVLALLST